MPTDGFDLSGLTEDVNQRAFGIDFWHQALLANNTMAFAAQHGEIKTGMKQDTYKMPLLEAPVALQEAGCGAEADTVATVTQREMKMVGVQAAGQFCPQELEPYFLADFIPTGQNNEDFNPLQSAIVARIQEEIAKKMAIFPWYGPTGSDTVTYTTSWLGQLRSAINIVMGSSTITAGGSVGTDAAGAYNVVDALIQPFLNNSDTAGLVYTDNELVVAMSPFVVDLYFKNYRTRFGDHNITPSYETLANGVAMGGWFHPGTRVRVVVQNALGRTQDVVITRRRNLVLGFDLAADATGMKLWYDINTDLIKWRMKAKLGTGIRSITPSSSTPNILYWGAAS